MKNQVGQVSPSQKSRWSGLFVLFVLLVSSRLVVLVVPGGLGPKSCRVTAAHALVRGGPLWAPSWGQPGAQEAQKTPSGSHFGAIFAHFPTLLLFFLRSFLGAFSDLLLDLCSSCSSSFFRCAQKGAHAESTGPANTFPCFSKVHPRAAAATRKQNRTRKHRKQKPPKSNKF